MNKKSRRNLLKGLAIGAPAVWAKPVVNSVVLPAHAQSSLPAGCYKLVYESGIVPSSISSIFWEGGIGVNQSTVFTYLTSDCTGGDTGWSANSVAISESAQDALDAGLICIEGEFSSPDLPDNLRFFLCD